MPYLMKTGQWRAAKMISGQRKTKTFATKGEAKKWEAEQTEKDWQRPNQETHTVSLFDVATAYLDYSKGRFSKKTYNEKKLAFKRLFVEVNPAITPDELQAKQCLAVLSKTAHAVSGAAANKDRKNLCAFWIWGMEYHGFPPVNVFQVVKKFPESPEGHYVPPVADFWKAYGSAEKTDQTFLLFLLHTGARKGEAFALEWEDIDFQGRRVRLGTCKTRDGSRRRDWLTMTNRLHSAMADHKMLTRRTSGAVFRDPASGLPFTERQHYMRRLCKRAGVKPFGFHGIRGLTATILASEGVPLPEIQHILRHTSPATTARYVRKLGFTQDRLSDVFDKIEMTPRTAILRVAK